MKAFLHRQWFLLCLALVLLAGSVFSHLLEPLAKAAMVRNLSVSQVIFMTALVLETRAMWEAMRRPWAMLLAVVMSYGALPLLAWWFASFLSSDLGLGVLVAATAPCTLASAAVWTRRAGGNDAVALIVTIVTSTICFVVTPLWLVVATGRSHVEVDVGDMMWKLALLVVLPVIAAQLLRQAAAVATWADRQKRVLSVLSQCGILYIVMLGAIMCGLHLRTAGPVEARALVGMIVCVALLHSVILFLGALAGRACGMPRGDWIAVGISGSQKTLPVGLHVAFLLGGGVLILPVVVYHVAQLLIDTVVADRLAEHET